MHKTHPQNQPALRIRQQLVSSVISLFRVLHAKQILDDNKIIR